MLQINTGKLFQQGIGRKNQLRGVLYTNAWLMPESDIETRAGALRPINSGPKDRALVYELEELFEKEKDGQGVLISHNIGPYLDDFSSLATFGLRALFSRDYDHIKEMVDSDQKYHSNNLPQNFVRRYFDEYVTIMDNEREQFVEFVDQLLSLKRQYFLTAMRAIKTFVAALNSIPSDLALAYTLLVSSVETLSQQFDGYDTKWTDLEENKRKNIDKALKGLSPKRIDSVHEAIIKADHLALSRRYREFILTFINDDYFRTGDALQDRPVARWEIPIALKQAYNIRSQYIHSAKPLPHQLTLPHEHWEITQIDRRPAFTINGLVRLTHHVITNFINGGPKTDREIYDYRLERAGIVTMEMAPQYWVGHPLTDGKHGRKRLEGFLSQLATCDTRQESAALTDLRPMLKDVEALFPRTSARHQAALYTLHMLFNQVVKEDQRSENWHDFYKKHLPITGQALSEILIARTILGDHNWDLDLHQRAYECYWTERTTQTSLQAPALYEAAAALDLAERYRKAENFDQVKKLVSEAVECLPTNESLRSFEEQFEPTEKIIWRYILLPKATAETSTDTP